MTQDQLETQTAVPVEQSAEDVSEQEQEQPQQQSSADAPQDVSIDSQEESSEGTPKKRAKKKARKLTEADMQPPKPSFWPLALALAIVIMMAGSAFNAIFFAIGGVLVLVCVVGWALERRR
ncbi:MAG TPA: cytochrome c oxidase subunit 4 [Ktedonobacteraceae bacterium]